MDNEDLYRRLVVVLKMFKNQPYHLAKYLIENSALTDEFINRLLSSGKLKELSSGKDMKLLESPYFLDITQMDNFYNSFIEDINDLSKEKSAEEVAKEINNKLDELIKQEKYEEAARVRDYMIRNNIKRNF